MVTPGNAERAWRVVSVLSENRIREERACLAGVSAGAGLAAGIEGRELGDQATGGEAAPFALGRAATCASGPVCSECTTFAIEQACCCPPCLQAEGVAARQKGPRQLYSSSSSSSAALAAL